MITFEEWWIYEKKRLKAGKGPSERVITKRCPYCHVKIGEKGGLYPGGHSCKTTGRWVEHTTPLMPYELIRVRSL